MRGALPWLSLLLVVVSLSVHFLPETLTTALQFDRAAIADGQVWRLVTAHFAHFSGAHLLGNTLAIALWAPIVECTSRRLLALDCSVGALALGTWILWNNPEFGTYRGLSGLAALLLSQVLLLAIFDHSLDRTAKCGIALLALALGFKAHLEASQGRSLVMGELGLDVVVAGDIHVYGALVGATLLGLRLMHRRRALHSSAQHAANLRKPALESRNSPGVIAATPLAPNARASIGKAHRSVSGEVVADL
jgi:rhomboid family GlyGly-CTERM serine protease